jgi:type II secretion system protein I
VLKRKKGDKELEDFTPDILIFANGDLSSFEIGLQREGRARPRAHLHRRAVRRTPAAARRSRTEGTAGPQRGGAMKQRGFTLLEVLIALAIVALSVGALLGTVTSSGSNVSYLHDKTLAEWVALNRLTEIRTAKLMPDAGKRTGQRGNGRHALAI